MLETKFVEKIKTRISYSVIFLIGNSTVYEIRWKNAIEPENPQMTM
jgi:hypothetical protein